ncbi:uncharacterized protein LOC131040429 isoform X2 [Cryptomeria japonica]|uniref:uncharacterized protein LOC131040429 isoform X2 n=1 Tax=Cryptomeria japonica TaxID=3369 RepID=UPI0027DA9532|nr:uncharacterized protein LOC131040429 isoform X2 [Cryptomeria japonica]
MTEAEEGEEVVFVTGCTPGGIGHALAVEFARRKCRVVATARSLSSLEALRTNSLVTLHTLELDVLSERSVEEAVRSVVDMFGRIDILVNNAGVHCVGPLAELPMALWQSTFDTNVFGTMRVIKAVVPHMASRRKGKIVNVGSVSALVPSPWTGAYSSSKAAIHCLSESLRNLPEWRLYKPFERAIRERVEFSQKPGCTPTDAFANKTVDAALRRKPPPWFSYGQFSTLAAIMYYFPIWLRDVIARRLFKLSAIENDKEK